MKKIITLLLLGFSVFATQGQGIRFVSSYEEALAQASKTKKRIFIDVYTQWCAPCKVMAAKTFPLEEVGDFFNDNFISLQLDAETANGKILAKKFGVSAYPTLVFLDYEGNLLGKESGARDAKGLIELAKNCQNPLLEEVNVMTKKFEAKQLDRKGLEVYLQLLRDIELPVAKPLEAWLKILPEDELFSEKTYNEIRKYRQRPGDYSFDFLLNHYDVFAQKVDKAIFDSYLYVNCLFECYENNRAKIDNELYWQKLAQKGLYFVPALRENYELVVHLLKDPSRTDEFIARSRRITETYPVCASGIGSEMIKRAFGKNTQLMEYAKELLVKAAEFNPKSAASVASGYVSVLLINAGDYETANYWVDKYIEWSGNPNYEHEKTLVVKRALGLVECENYGKQMYDFRLSDLNGQQVALSDFRGKYVLLDFWASWCEPCKGELPFLKAAYEKYGKDQVAFIGITCDKEEHSWKEAVNKEGMVWIQLTANQSDVYEQYHINGIPRIMLLDKEGRLVGDKLRGKNIDMMLKKIVQ